jgi:hypothetical protein
MENARPRQCCRARENPKMLKFYFNGAPNPNKISLFL